MSFQSTRGINMPREVLIDPDENDVDVAPGATEEQLNHHAKEERDTEGTQIIDDSSENLSLIEKFLKRLGRIISTLTQLFLHRKDSKNLSVKQQEYLNTMAHRSKVQGFEVGRTEAVQNQSQTRNKETKSEAAMLQAAKWQNSLGSRNDSFSQNTTTRAQVINSSKGSSFVDASGAPKGDSFVETAASKKKQGHLELA